MLSGSVPLWEQPYHKDVAHQEPTARSGLGILTWRDRVDGSWACLCGGGRDPGEIPLIQVAKK